MADVLQLIRENQQKHARGEDTTRLDIGNCGLTELPDALFECVWLEELVLSTDWYEWNIGYRAWQLFKSQNKGNSNLLSGLDSRFSVFSKLKKIALRGLKLNSLVFLNLISSLTSIDISKNQLISLEPLKNLMNLRSLYIYQNAITSVEPLKSLSNLVGLSVAYNKLTSLKPFQDLTNLTNLRVNDNQITSLEQTTGHFEKEVAKADFCVSQDIIIDASATLTQI